MEYLDYSGQVGFHDEEALQHHQPYGVPPVTTTGSSLQDPGKAVYYDASSAGQQQVNCDIKPRLTKDQHDVLEEHYSRQPKPNTITKKEYAEDLGVSLDKVNNWFQNRRAKSKQDAKKAQGALNLLHHQQAHQYNFSSGSDSETSPAFSTADFMSAMNQYAPDEQTPSGLGILPGQHLAENGYFASMPDHAQFQQDFQSHHVHQLPQEMFDSPQELNRRTLTQEQFDAFAHNGSMMDGTENLDAFNAGVSGNHDVYGQIFPELHDANTKQPQPQHAFTFPYDAHAPLSSNDSTIPSSASERSTNPFPSSTSLQGNGNTSSASSEYTDSRSSSVSMGQQDDTFMQMSAAPMQAANTSTSQWQPGQSVPVDFNALNEQFRRAATQARPVPQVHEQPLAWPADEAYVRRDSQTANMLAQSMSNVGIQTPQVPHTAVLESPTPATSIATRRQRPRPAALGLASLRSQSYSGAMQPGSPGQMPQPHALTPGSQPLRRIRSSNVMNGVTQGRVQKPLPVSAQRSPLAWTFAESVNSPKAIRHASSQSSGSLAPPTPMSPNEFPRPEQQQRAAAAFPSFQHAVSRQPSLQEIDFEHNVPFAPQANFSSPPHTPMYHPQAAMLQQRVGNNVITENTPPQSAPATQQCFSLNQFATPQHHVPAQLPQMPSTSVQHMPPYVPVTQQQQMMNVMELQQQQMYAPPAANVMYGPTVQPPQQFAPPPPMTSVPEVPMQFTNGVPIVDAQGQLRMAFPPQIHQQPPVPMPAPQQIQQQPPPPPPPQQHQQQHQFQIYPTTTPGASPSAVQPKQQAVQPPQPAAELFVHEYSPPQDIKRAATPRKMVDTGPKNYTFANQGPEHFGKDKVKKDSASKAATAASSAGTGASNSPAGSSGVSATS